MAINHERPLPVSRERLDHLALLHVSGFKKFDDLPGGERREILMIAMLGELIEQQQQTAFYLGEAYDIYNQRFR